MQLDTFCMWFSQQFPWVSGGFGHTRNKHAFQCLFYHVKFDYEMEMNFLIQSFQIHITILFVA